MDNGWIKVHRKILDNPLWKDCNNDQRVIMITLLLMANHESNRWIFRGEEYQVEEGQFITSLPKLVSETGCTTQVVRTALAKFEKHKFLTDKSTNKNRLITIENWSKYQGNKEDTNSQTNRQLTGNQQATNRQLTPNKNDKNDKNDKNIITTSFSLSQKALEEVIEKWNGLGLSQVRSIKAGTKRYENLQARIREYGIDDVLKAINAVRESNYLQGDNPRGWQIDLGWMVLPDKFPKVLEGQYANRSRGTVKARSKHDSSFDEDHKPMFRRSI